MLTLTPLSSDNFTRANEDPLSQGGNWVVDGFGDPALQIVSDVCEGTSSSGFSAELYTGVTLPSGQYSQVTLNTALVTFLNAMLGSRLTDNGSSFRSLPGYVLEVEGNGSWFLDSNGSFILGGSGLTFSIGDV